MSATFENRKQQRKVIETMDAIAASMSSYLNDDTKETVHTALDILRNTEVNGPNVSLENNVLLENKVKELEDRIEQLIDTVMVYKQSQLPDGNCPYAYFGYQNYECRDDGDCIKCKSDFFYKERRKLEQKYQS